MLFLYPPYSGCFLHSSGQYWDNTVQDVKRDLESQPTFQALLAIERKTARTDVGGGMTNQAMMEINKRTRKIF